MGKPRKFLAFQFEFTNGGTCCRCGIPMIFPSWYYTKRLEDHEDFYCLNGHAQHFTGKSEAQKLRDEVARKDKQLEWARQRETSLREERTHLEHKLNGTKGALAKVKKRVANGVCPCCRRSFPNLGRHMSSEHPDYAAE